ncbi:MAG: DEAD/DEAH box helicase family protein [Ignavibacteriales bacterium]|nr:DEAD/DEAH box helicase family protein [Ignavibacteriales bacterium]
MYLKNYQIKVIKALKAFYYKAHATRGEIEKAAIALPQHLRHSLNWVSETFNQLGYTFVDLPMTGLGFFYPRVVIKVPTGGGKTLLAVEAIREYQNLFVQRKTGLVVWVVPSETIYSQTLKKLRDKGNYLRQLLDQASAGNTLIVEKGQRISRNDIEQNLVILFVMIQSVSRLNGKEALKVFQDSGGYEDFFPLDHRYDLHKQLIEKVPNLDIIAGTDSAMPQIRTSLGNAIRLTNPLIIIDEIHKVFSDTQQNTIDNLNPSMVLGFSATPREDMNILVSISGLELKKEDMIKLDMHIFPPTDKRGDGWQRMLQEIKDHRDRLEKKAKTLLKNRGLYIRPIALVQVEATGKDQRGKGRVHSLDAKEELIRQGISADEIAIKTSSQNDIEDVDLFSQHCTIRYIITKEALKEGWDCSYAYILGVIPNVSSNTSITQLIGRILRQPYAAKTKIPELDESYVYYAKGQSGDLIKQVDAGFKSEGLEDLISKVKPHKSADDLQKKNVRIKKEFQNRYRNSFYLPVWLIVEDKTRRRKFSYDIDIKSHLEFNGLALSKTDIDRIEESLSEQTKERKAFAVTLDEQSHTKVDQVTEEVHLGDQVSLNYMTRRFADVIENPFLARKKAVEYMMTLEKRLSPEKLDVHFGFIVAQLMDFLNRHRVHQEEVVFRNQLASGKLVLTVSDDERFGYSIPKQDTISIDRSPNPYSKNLYDDLEVSSLNSLETKVAHLLDNQEKLIWWFRNNVSRGYYAIQGWRKEKIHPDFVAAKRKTDGSLELVYVLESKGEHLLGNDDTEYKNSVLTQMTQTPITPYQMELEFGKVNDKIGFYLVPQGEEDRTIGTLFSDSSLNASRIPPSKAKRKRK